MFPPKPVRTSQGDVKAFLLALAVYTHLYLSSRLPTLPVCFLEDAAGLNSSNLMPALPASQAPQTVTGSPSGSSTLG